MWRPKISQTEFIRNYCKNSDIAESKLNERGVFAFPCSCDYDGCEGWQMGNADSMWSDYDLKREWTMTEFRKDYEKSE